MHDDESPIIAVPTGEFYTDAGGNKRESFHNISFRWEAQRDDAASEAAMREVYNDVLVLRYHYPGEKEKLDYWLALRRPGAEKLEILERDQWRLFGTQAQAYVDKTQSDAMGTPLSLLNISRAEQAMLRAVGIATIEALAAVPDGALRNFEGSRALRDRALSYLDKAAANVGVSRVETENAALKSQLEQMQAQIAALMAARADDDEPVRRKPGRPRKEVPADG